MLVTLRGLRVKYQNLYKELQDKCELTFPSTTKIRAENEKSSFSLFAFCFHEIVQQYTYLPRIT